MFKIFNYNNMMGMLLLGIILLSLNGCALAPAAISAAAGIAAEGVSIKTTGNTISENLKEAMTEEKEIVQKEYIGIPPRKPAPPESIDNTLVIKPIKVYVGFPKGI